MFDESRARRAINFFERVLVHTHGEFDGKPFLLMPWQRRIVGDLFGTLNDDDLRQYREAYIEVPKKNGKSELAAGIALYLLAADGERGAQIFGAASARDQAAIVFSVAASMVEKSPVLSARLRVLRSGKIILVRDDPGSFYKVISADGDVQDGVNPHAVITDEYHRWKVQKAVELDEVLTRGMIARRQPLAFRITTAGIPDEAPLCWPKHQYADQVETGVIDDPEFYGRIYGAGPDDDWKDEKTWAKANPSLDVNGGFLRSSAIRSLFRKAENDPGAEPHFRRYHLNTWGQHEERAIRPEEWSACAGSLRALVERPCYAGLDLSQKWDLSSLVLVFPCDEDKTFDVLPFFWLPQERLRKAGIRDKVPYPAWARSGQLETTEGDVIDTRAIADKIRWAQQVFELREVGFDPWNATELSIALGEEGISFVPIRQGPQSMSEPSKKLVELVKSKRLRHAGHEVLAWNADCLTWRCDRNDNIAPSKPDRRKSDKRIDGMVALIMALDRASRNGHGLQSVYETRGLLYL